MYMDGSIIANSLVAGVTLLVLASFIAGYLDAVAGGAGLILVPAFILTGLPPQMALGQEKLVSTIGTIAAIKNFFGSRSIIWRIVPFGIVAALLGAYFGAKSILWLPRGVISGLIIGLLPIGLIATFVKSRLMKNADGGEVNYNILSVLITCSIVGFYDGFFGPGTGSIFIIALFTLNNLPLLQASATSKIFNFSSNVGAFVAFSMAGKMLYLIGIPMILASLAGNHLGSNHAIKSGGEVIKKTLVITVFVMMGTLIYRMVMA